MKKTNYWKREIILMLDQITSEVWMHRIYNHVSRIYAAHKDK